MNITEMLSIIDLSGANPESCNNGDINNDTVTNG